MKKIVLTVVAAMTITLSFAKTENTTAVKEVENYGITFFSSTTEVSPFR